MEAGTAYARQYQLTPGVALTGEQMAMLTTDIVWLTTRTVTLPDGNTTQVLAPQVYLRRPEGGDLRGDGSLIAADNLFIQTQSTLLQGAVARGHQVTAHIGGNLNIESLQDTRTYDSQQQSIEGSVGLCLPPFCYDASSTSANVGKSTIDQP